VMISTNGRGALSRRVRRFSHPCRFLGPRMIYTSGIVLDNTIEESLETLQDNKLAVVCNKLDLKPTDRYVLPFKRFPILTDSPNSLLDVGCGWGTLVAYAAKNYDCDATGVTLAVNQAKFGTDRIAKNGVCLSGSFNYLY
jgi:cyclopropane fatty-acyl-phospholipid synthase-like methyltransferase